MSELKNLEIREVSFVDEGANPESFITFFKRKKQNKMVEKQEVIAPVEKTVEEQNLQENFAELTTTLANLTKRLNAHIEKAEDAEWLKVASKYEILGEDATKLAKVLKLAKSAGGETYNTTIKLLDNALAAVQKSGTFEEIGKSGSTGTPDADKQIAKFTAEICKRNPALSERQALIQAYEEHPELKD